MSLNFETIRKAGLTQNEFAHLLSAQRVTVNNWVNGRSEPHKMWRKKCAKYLTLLTIAVRKGDLPGDLPPIYKDNMEERMSIITQALETAAEIAKEKIASRSSETANA